MEQLAPLLEKLANELGTTSQFLWNVLVKQAKAEAILYGIWVLIGLVALIITLYRLYKSFKPFVEYYKDGSIREEYKNKWKRWESNDISELMFLGFVISILVSAIIIIINLYNVVVCLVNPEYWALQQILEKL